MVKLGGIMYSGIKYRIYPNKKQEILLLKHFGCARWIYNYSLMRKSEAWNNLKENISLFKIKSELPRLKKTKETQWLSEVNAQSLQSEILNLDKAYSSFFKGKSGFPKFKNKKTRQSFTVPQNGVIGKSFVKIPIVGKLKAAISKEIDGKINKVTISRSSSGKYFASVLFSNNSLLPSKLPPTEIGTVGIDLGIKIFATLSDERKIENPKFLKLGFRRIKRLQHSLSRQRKGSNNKSKRSKLIAIKHEKVANQRKDFLHKLTAKLIRDNQVDSYAIEDLAVSDMLKNKQLSKHISDCGWREFRTQLEYKAEKAGKNVLVIGRFEPSSKTCSCGKINNALTLKDRIWSCSCGLTHDRDLLAAQNIKRFAFIPKDIREFTLEEIKQ